MSKSNDDKPIRRILILGGTGEARQLASALLAKGFDVRSSLAGRTVMPVLPEGPVRVGGFGGVEGLADYLRSEKITHFLDVTHPFAAQISANAVAAATLTHVPLLRLERPAWRPHSGENWVDVADLDQTVTALPSGAAVLLTVGRQGLPAFFKRSDCRFVARVIDAPETVPESWTVITDRGPFALADELALMRTHTITHLVSKNSGGEQAASKLEAARALGVQVMMVRRPVLPAADVVATVEAALNWAMR